MAEFTVNIKTLSPIHLGSGQASVNLDADIVHDNFGLPYFPAKRFKGLLYESAVEVAEMFALADLNLNVDLNKIFNKKYYASDTVRLIVPNFYIKPLAEYKTICKELNYLQSIYKFVRPADVLAAFTSVRYQTQLDNGIAVDGSLRNLRVLDGGVDFCGKVTLIGADEQILTLLSLAVRNLSAAGTKRNRGFGKINCSIIFDDGKSEDFYIDKIFGGE